MFKVNQEGNTETIVERTLSALGSLEGNYQDAFYAYEVANVTSLVPDSSIISSIMDERFNVIILSKIAGTDNQDDNQREWSMHLTYTNVIVGVVIPANN